MADGSRSDGVKWAWTPCSWLGRGGWMLDDRNRGIVGAVWLSAEDRYAAFCVGDSPGKDVQILATEEEAKAWLIAVVRMS